MNRGAYVTSFIFQYSARESREMPTYPGRKLLILANEANHLEGMRPIILLFSLFVCRSGATERLLNTGWLCYKSPRR